jgi:precorrin-2 dehydrogenase/sirohydrochlorin ferrochelatase
VAWRKAKALAETGAEVKVVSPEFCDALWRLDGVGLIERPFEEGDVAGATLVFAATDDAELNRNVARAARRSGALVNVVDTPAECDFIVPSTLVRGDLMVSISTSSAAPALSRRLRLELEELLPEAYRDFVALLGELRRQVMGDVADPERRRTILTQLADRPTWKLFDQGGSDAVRALARNLINETA